VADHARGELAVFGECEVAGDEGEDEEGDGATGQPEGLNAGEGRRDGPGNVDARLSAEKEVILSVTQIDIRGSKADTSGMAIRTSLNVSLTPELEKFVQGRVTSGRYQTASEVIREGLRLLEQQERDRDAAHKALKEKLARGVAHSERGELADGERFLDELIGRFKAKRRKSGAA